MKTLSALLLATFTFSAFSSDLYTTIREIEVEKNAKCEPAKKKWYDASFCSVGYGERIENMEQNCNIIVRFKCLSNEGNFGLKIRTNEKTGQVFSVKYLLAK